MNFINKFTITPNQRTQIITKLKEKQITPIFDYVFERCNREEDFIKVDKELNEHLREFSDYPMAIKLSAYCDFNLLRGHEDIQDNIERFSKLYNKTNNTIYIDAEEISTINLHNYFINECWLQNIMVGKTYQMYIKDEIKKLERDIKFLGNYGHYKIVRGAYWHQDKNTDKLFRNKEDTDNQYNDAIELTSHLNNVLYATHNEKSLQKIPEGKKVCQLLGLKDKLSEEMTKTHEVFKYVPYGNLYESVPYLTRRLYENISILKHI